MTEYAKDGALYELVARGNKDKYFQADTITAVSPFRNNYKKIPAFVHELRKIPPINNSYFGKVVEFDFEVAGDVFTHPTLLIDLPTWLPSEYASINYKSVIQDTNSNTYGYTRGIGYFLFSNIQIYQDQILLQEFSGDALYASRLSRGSINSAMLENKLIGYHDGSNLSIGRNATPSTLRLELPLIGCQSTKDGGFPSFAIRSQNLRLRLTLRKLEDLVESSDSQSKPTPWGRSDFQIKTSQSGSFTNFSTLDFYKMDQLTLYLETRHVYVDPVTQKELVENTLEYPYSRLFENILYFNNTEYAPLLRGAIASITRRIDAIYIASRLIFFLRTKTDMDANKLWKISSNTVNQEYYNNLKLIIASRDREHLFSSLLWNLITQTSKEDRYGGVGLGIMNWDLDCQQGRLPPFSRQPEGGINFSEADRPTIYMELQQISDNIKNTEMRVILDTWSIYDTENKRGGLKYAN